MCDVELVAIARCETIANRRSFDLRLSVKMLPTAPSVFILLYKVCGFIALWSLLHSIPLLTVEFQLQKNGSICLHKNFEY